MAVDNALAGVAVRDLEAAVAWYERLLGRPADKRPMDELAEWQFARGGWIQVFEDRHRAGFSSVTLTVPSLDAQLAELKAKGIAVERSADSKEVRIAIVADPDANQVVFAEALSDAVAR